MNPLIGITQQVVGTNTVPTCNARDLWRFLESKQQFSNWIKSRLLRHKLVEGEDFIIHTSAYGIGQKVATDYHLILDVAKALAMAERNAKGKEVRKYFIECERMLEAAQPKTYAEALRMAADREEALEKAKLTYTAFNPNISHL